MPKADQLLDRIRTAIRRPDNSSGMLDELVQEYIQAVDQVNERLGRCVALARQGRSSEAVHLAELSPPVLDEAAAFDFPELDEWLALCEMHDQDGLPEVDYDAMGVVDSLFTVVQQLDRLLTKHRRLAVGRAPLVNRITVLRKLAKADPGNAFWNEDLTDLEKARQKQLAVESERAWRKRDRPALVALHRECLETWLVPPPRDIAESLSLRIRRCVAENALALLPKIEQRLGDALAKQDFDAVKSLVATWEQTASQAGEESAADPPDLIVDAHTWLEETATRKAQDQQFNADLQRLEDALDRRIAADEIERIWSAVLRHDRAVSSVLQRRTEARLAESQLEQSRRFRLKAIAIFGLLACVSAGVALLVHWSIESREAQAWHGRISTAIDDENWIVAQELIDQLEKENPQLFGEPDMQAMFAPVAPAIEADQARKERFASLMEQLQTDLNPELLNEASKLARDHDERLQVEQLRDQLRQTQFESQKSRDESFTAALDAMRNQFSTIRQEDQPLASAIEDLGQIDNELSSLLNREGVSTALQSSAGSFQSSVRMYLTSLKAKKSQSDARADALSNIARDISKPQLHIGRMQNFIESFPADPLSGEFEEALQARKGWIAVDNWPADEIARWKSLRVSSIEEIDERRNVLREALNAGDANPYADVAREYQAYLMRALSSLNQANAPGNRHGDLLRLLGHPLISNLSVMKRNDGGMYYLPSDVQPRLLGEKVLLKHIMNPSQLVEGNRFAESMIPASRFVDPEKVELSPQSRYAVKAGELIKRFPTDWETLNADLYRLIKAYPDMDPILHVTIGLELVLRIDQYDWRARPNLKQWAEQADMRNFSRLTWMNPDDPTAQSGRKDAENFIRKLDDLIPESSELDNWLVSMKSRLVPRVVVGMLLKQSDGIKLVARRDLPSEGRLQLIMQEGSTAAFVDAGRVNEGDVQWTSVAQKQPSGTLIYLVANDEAGND